MADYLSSIKKLIFILSILFVLSSCQKKDGLNTPITECKAPEFSLNSLDGNQVKLSDYYNKVVVLFFFGNDCPSCKAAAQSVENILFTPFASRTDYQVLGLDQWNGNSALVQAFKTATGVSFPLLLNASSVASDYKTTHDWLVVIDKKGNIVFSGTLITSANIVAVKQKVEILLGTQSINPPDDTISVINGNAPDFSLNSLSGSVVRLSNFKNNVIVLYFFGSDCPTCILSAISVESMLVTSFASRPDFQVLGLEIENGTPASVQAFKTASEISFPLLLNASGVAVEYNTIIDRLVIIDKKGNIVFSGTQGVLADIEEVKQKVESLF